MCSVEDDGEIRPVKNDSNQSLRGKNCVKCDQPGVLITRIHDCFCKSCFQVYVIHKFRAAIGKSKLIREGEHVLLAFSGGANSAALLHLIQDGLSDRAHRKLRFTPTILHIDECGALNVSSDARQELRQKVVKLMLESGFPGYIVDLEQAVDIERKRTAAQNGTGTLNGDCGCVINRVEDESSTSVVDTLQHDKLRSLIDSVASLTGQEDFLRHLRNQLIVCVARQLGFSKVLTAECSTRLSIKILTDVAQGRGSQVSLNTAFCDQRNGDVLFVRPVRDLNAKELAMYNTLFEVDSVFIPSITTKTATDSSIERLTESFVNGLQADFSSTVANIVRTAGKLETDIENSQACTFCQSPLDTCVGKASALYAVEFSQRISQAGRRMMSAGCHGDDTEYPVGGGGPAQRSCCRPESVGSRMSTSELNKSLCYGCRVTLQNFNFEASSLPNLIKPDPAAREASDLLREKISEFLLEDIAS